MKTIISPVDFVSYGLYPDDQRISLTEEDFIIHYENRDLQISREDRILVENVTDPGNHKPTKYKLIDNQWVINPFYVSPV